MGGKDKKQVIASALAKHLGISLGEISSGLEASDIKTLYSTLLKTSGKWSPQKESDEVMKWIAFVESFPADPSKSCFAALAQFNEDLSTKSVVLGNGFTPSEADIIVFAVVHSSVIGLPNPEREKLQNVLRWMSYIQNREDFGKLFEKILVEKPDFDFGTPLRYLMSLQQLKDLSKLEADSNSKKTPQIIKETDKSKEDLNVKENAAKGKITGTQESTKEKKKQPDAELVEKDKELSVSLLNIQVGLIRKAWKHPSADSLLVEEIDVGDAKLRQVVSGLAKYYSPDELMNRRVVLITNVKPGKLRDVMSEGLVLCASNEDHTAVEPLLPPPGAKIGEWVSFSGYDGKPEDVLNPKKKQLEKITLNLFTDDKGVATFKGIPFMTSGGPCTSSLPKASIK